MFFLGLLGFFQVTCLPGLLALRALRFRGGIIHAGALAFGLSLLANYLAVFLLCLAGLYRQGVLLGLAALELAALAWLYRDVLKLSLEKALSITWKKTAAFFIRLSPKISQEEETTIQVFRLVFLILSFALAAGSVLWMVQVFRLNLGTVFNTWDAVVSWNRWAVSWAGGIIPPDTGYYPQLLPVNWSMTYVFTGNTAVQFFAKAIAPLFFLFILLLQVDLGIDARSTGIFLGTVITRLATKKFAGEFIADGYCDLPATFLGFLSIYLLLKLSQTTDRRARLLSFWFGALTAAAAALTKQTGNLILLLFPLLAWLLVLQREKAVPAAEKRRMILLPFAVALVLAASWYLYKYFTISQGWDTSNIAWVTDGIFQGRSLPERGIVAFQTLEKYAFVFLFALLSLPVLRSAYRWLVLLVVLPIILIWTFYFSYDTRNLVMVLPFLGLTAGLGIEGYFEAGLRLLHRLRPGRLRLAVLAGLVLLLLPALTLVFPAQKLTTQQIILQKQIFSPTLNRQLYAYIEENGLEGKILTEYPVSYLPGLEDRQVEFWFCDLSSFIELQNRPDIAYILLPQNACSEVVNNIEEKLSTGEYQQIFEDDRFIPHRFIRILKKQP